MAIDKYDIDYIHTLEECIANFPIGTRLILKEPMRWRAKGIYDVDSELRKKLYKILKAGDSVMVKGYYVDDENNWYPIIEDRNDLWCNPYYAAWSFPLKYEIYKGE